MSSTHRVVFKRRAAITALPLYYSGHLLKKYNGEKDFKKYYVELRGSTLFLYKDDTQDTYTEKLDLQTLKYMMLDSSCQKKPSTIFTLSLQTEEVQLKMDNPDTGEVWKGFIMTVAKKEVPSRLQLLPGQMVRLEEVLAEEKRRQDPSDCPVLPPRPGFLMSPSSSPPAPPLENRREQSTSDMPPCFYAVTRQKAEQMLEEKPEYGSIILRPSTLANNYAVTLRQVCSSGPVMKNYRVTSTGSGFVIELHTPVTAPSLSEVLKYFLEQTEYRLHPYTKIQPYDTRIELPLAPKCTTISSTTPKIVPQAQVAPMSHSQSKKLPPHMLNPTKAAEEDYIVPDEDLKKGLQLDVDHTFHEAPQIQTDVLCTNC
ncbi:signal-transducing adaptor protein 1-like [Polymixia lowei]